MSWHVSVSGANAVVARMDKIQSTLRSRLQEAMEISVRDIQERARDNHRFITRNGDAERSIDKQVSGSGDSVVGVVGTTRLITIYLHQGTPAHIIEPRTKKALRWAAGGDFVFAKRVQHPGIKKDPFIFNAADAEAGSIKSRFDAIIDGLE